MNPLTPTQEHTVYALAADLMARADSDGDRARIDRAIDLVSTVERSAQPSVWLVGSQSETDTVYHVTRYSCSCWDHAKRGGPCKHQRAVELFQQVERADAEQTDPTLADDPDATRIALTGRGYLALVPTAALPPAEGGITVKPYTASQYKIASELYDDIA